MDKAAIKKFAVSARKKLIAAVEQKAFELGITENTVKEAEIYQDGFLINGIFYKKYQINQRDKLLKEMEQKGYNQVIEEVAYTWFNRFIALRFMEVNDYLPTGIRIFSSIETGKKEPDALTEVELLIDDLELEAEKVYELQDANDDEDLFKYIFIKQCNKLGEIMPVVFERIDDETELLLPNSLVTEGSVINDLVTLIDEVNWEDVEIIGWLYQFYNSEIKERVGGLKNNAVPKEYLPVVTQLFTPKWIVQYMVENSLGKLYDELKPNNTLANDWEYYLKSDSSTKLDLISIDSVENVKVVDPACGSGHILLYVFDLLYDIYIEAGYIKRDIPELILKNNIYGLDIDKRSTQIAVIALWMKALEKEPSLIHQGKTLMFNVIEIIDSDQTLSDEAIQFLVATDAEELEIKNIQEAFENGKQFGSLIAPPNLDYQKYITRIEEYQAKVNDLYKESLILELKDKLLPVLFSGLYLNQKYDVVVTNPPYHNKFNAELKKFMQKYYKDTKSDLYSAFIGRTVEMSKKYGYVALMTPLTWMFISSHEKLRNFILRKATISSLVQLEYSAFKEATVPICTFVIQNQKSSTTGEYVRLAEFKGSDLQPIKLREAVTNINSSFRYSSDSITFSDIPGSPIAYWVSDAVRKHFRYSKTKLNDVGEPRRGLQTGKAPRFIRIWHEVSIKDTNFINNRNRSKIAKWYHFNNGGIQRKWYGNVLDVVLWENNGEAIKSFERSIIPNEHLYFKRSISWNKVTSVSISARINQENFLQGDASPFLYTEQNLYYYLALLNNKVSEHFLKIISPTLNFQVGDIGKIPISNQISENNLIEKKAVENIDISKSDWDSLETSWDFETHPFIEFKQSATKISEVFTNWQAEAENRFQTLKANEEELNRIFIELYGLQDELTPEVQDKDVTIRRADQIRDVKSFLSYAVGLMFGRYSLDKPGLAYAGGEFDLTNYQTFIPDEDNVLPIATDVYFEDDIVNRFITIVKTVFGSDHLEANLDFIADTLVRRSNESSRERIRRYFLKEFYKDHLQTYQKRPIYWLFDSGKQDGFKALIYLHRYQPDLVARVRTSYLHAQVRKYQDEITRLDYVLEADVSKPEQTKAKKRKEVLQKQVQECLNYDQVIAHVAHQTLDLDLDDGVKVNYEKFQNIEVPLGEGKKPLKANVLAKI